MLSIKKKSCFFYESGVFKISILLNDMKFKIVQNCGCVNESKIVRIALKFDAVVL